MNTRKRILLDEDESSAPHASATRARTPLDPLTPEEEAALLAVHPAPTRPAHQPPRRVALIAGLALGAVLLLLQTVGGLIVLTRDSPLLGLLWSTAFVLVAGAAAR